MFRTPPAVEVLNTSASTSSKASVTVNIIPPLVVVDSVPDDEGTPCPGTNWPVIATSLAQKEVVWSISGVLKDVPFPTILPPVAASYQYMSLFTDSPAPCASNITDPSPHTVPEVVFRISNEVQGTSVVVIARAAPSQPWKLWVT